MDIEKLKAEIEVIKFKDAPTKDDKILFCKYYLDAKGEEGLMKNLPKSWDKEEVKEILKQLKMERKPLPKRYYVSLKEPLEDTFSR